MSWIQTLLKFLPMIMQILAIFFGGGTLKSYSEVPSLMSTEGATFVGGQGLAAIISAFVAHWATIKQPEWGTTPKKPVSIQGGIAGIFKFVELFFYAFQLLGKDAEFIKKFKEVTGLDVPTSLSETAAVVTHLESNLRPVSIKSE